MARLILIVSSLSAFVHGQVGARDLNFLERALLSRAGVIVQAKFEKDESLHPLEIQITHFHVKRRLMGTCEDTILIGGMGEKAQAFRDLDKLLFLKPLSSGRVFELVDLVDLTARDEVSVPATVAAYLELRTEPNPLVSRQRLKVLSMRNLESNSEFCQRTAVHEVRDLVDRSPQLFSALDLDRIEARRKSVRQGDERVFDEILKRLRAAIARSFVGCELAFDDPTDRSKFLGFVERFRGSAEADDRRRLLDELVEHVGRRARLFCEAVLSDPSTDVRQRALFYLGEFGEEASFGVLQKAVASEAMRERKAAIVALGKLGRPEAVASLRELLKDPALIDDAILALARIGGGESTDLLDRLSTRLGEVPGEEERVGRMEHYRSQEFRKEEARRRLKARQTYSP